MLRSVRHRLATLAVLSCWSLQSHAQRSSFSVGTASAAPGKKANGYLEVPPGVDAATKLPVVVINGAKPGPVLALVSGAHGTEYVSIVALEKLINLLDPAEISGAVILLPLVNVPSFEQKVPHVNPIDSKSMNRFYPGNADGSQTERVSLLITKEVVDRIESQIEWVKGQSGKTPPAHARASAHQGFLASTRDQGRRRK